jgi:hypothetical protein
MSEITTTPATARTDTARTWRGSTAATAGIGATTARNLGLLLTAGAAAFATTFLVWGPQDPGFGGRLSDLGGLLFQFGLYGLLTVMLRTGATGSSRFARGMIYTEFVLLTLASVWSLLHAVLPDGVRDGAWLAVLDVFWPLSMLGMFVIGIKVAVVGHWTGLVRWWPLVAESWVVVTLPAMAVFGPAVGGVVGGAHLIVGYATLGALIARSPRDTGAA